MTQVTYARRGRRCRLELQGHATGSPAACAALSALSHALALYLLNHPGAVRLHALRQADAAFLADFSGGPAAQAAWETALLGALAVAAACPEQVEIERTFDDGD